MAVHILYVKFPLSLPPKPGGCPGRQDPADLEYESFILILSNLHNIG